MVKSGAAAAVMKRKGGTHTTSTVNERGRCRKTFRDEKEACTGGLVSLLENLIKREEFPVVL